MKSTCIFLITAFTAVFSSCKKDSVTGNGAVQTVERELTGFTKVATQGSTFIHIQQGAGFEVRVKGFANLLPYLKTTVENGVLLVRYQNAGSIRNDNSEVFIVMPKLTGLSSSGSGNISASGDFGSNADFDAEISGSATISVEKTAAEKFMLRSSGSGRFDSFGLIARDADIAISGSGDARITVDRSLKVKISGSGTLYYKGNPATIDNEVNGSGRVVKQ